MVAPRQFILEAAVYLQIDAEKTNDYSKSRPAFLVKQALGSSLVFVA